MNLFIQGGAIMSIKLVASDLDGTLVDHNNFIPARKFRCYRINS